MRWAFCSGRLVVDDDESDELARFRRSTHEGMTSYFRSAVRMIRWHRQFPNLPVGATRDFHRGRAGGRMQMQKCSEQAWIFLEVFFGKRTPLDMRRVTPKPWVCRIHPSLQTKTVPCMRTAGQLTARTWSRGRRGTRLSSPASMCATPPLVRITCAVRGVTLVTRVTIEVFYVRHAAPACSPIRVDETVLMSPVTHKRRAARRRPSQKRQNTYSYAPRTRTIGNG